MAYLVAVTACVSGVAHTYMAAERLEKLYQLEKWGVSIETQSALGTKHRLADEDIRRADVALLITDIELAGAERFEHCRYVQCSIYAFLREPQRVMSAVRKVLSAPQQTHLILEWSVFLSVGCGTADDIPTASVRCFYETDGRSSCCRQSRRRAPLLLPSGHSLSITS